MKKLASLLTDERLLNLCRPMVRGIGVLFEQPTKLSDLS